MNNRSIFGAATRYISACYTRILLQHQRTAESSEIGRPAHECCTREASRVSCGKSVERCSIPQAFETDRFETSDAEAALWQKRRTDERRQKRCTAWKSGHPNNLLHISVTNPKVAEVAASNVERHHDTLRFRTDCELCARRKRDRLRSTRREIRTPGGRSRHAAVGRSPSRQRCRPAGFCRAGAKSSLA
jgi:hypothetical protein